MKKNQVIVVGGGIAGLTATAFLLKRGMSVTLFEKEPHLGGLVNSFEREGYVFDAGLRAIESSGLIISTLNDLGIDLPLIKSTVSLGIEDRIIPMKDTEDINNFEEVLKHFYPDESAAIHAIIVEIKNVMSYMTVLLGGDAPVYADEDNKKKISFFKTFLPWLIKLLSTIPKISKLQLPVEEHLKKYTQNQALIDVIIQHFFKGTPASFALSYFLFYLDYNYPLGGTGSLTRVMEDYIQEKNCIIKTNTSICKLKPETKIVQDQNGNEYSYDSLIWAADCKYLYSIVDTLTMKNNKIKKRISQKHESLKDLRGAESVLTVYLGVDLEPSYFSSICTEHLFYTPDQRGLSIAKPESMDEWLCDRKPENSEENKIYIKNYLKNYFYYNTFEISFPVMRDPSLAPKGKTGLIVSCLFDYKLCKFIYDSGWYEEFKSFSQDFIIDILDKKLFPNLKKHTKLYFTATPLSIKKLTGNTDGAIVGWSFTNPHLPIPKSMINMPKAVLTTIPHVYQAGQWTYSPAGLPISILTGKVAANRVIRKNK